jgi:NAD+ kinase
MPLFSRVAIVVKETAYARYVERLRDRKTRTLLERGDASVAESERTHNEHLRTIDEVTRTLTSMGVSYTQFRFPEPLPRGCTMVITVGGDGTFLGTSHELGFGTPILGVNSAPQTSVGFFCAATRQSFAALMKKVVRHESNGSKDKSASRSSWATLTHTLQRMHVTLNQKTISSRVLNDALFCHASPAATTRYDIEVRNPTIVQKATHRSSGLWVGPPAGSTAAQRSAGGRVLAIERRALQYVVREPYAPHGKRPELTKGILGGADELHLLCRMRSGMLYLDGPDTAFPLELGDRLSFSLSNEPLTVVRERRSS